MRFTSPRRALASAGIGLSAAALLLTAAPAAAADPASASPQNAAPPMVSGWKVIAGGLHNPRGITAGNGTIYIAQSGTSGTFCPAPDQCAGLSGRISALNLWTSRQWTVARGFISLGDSHGNVFTGINDVTLDSRGNVIGLIGANRYGIPSGATGTVVDAAKAQLGRLVRISYGRYHVLADVGGYDYRWTAANKDKLDPNNPEWPDANPYGVDRVGDWIYSVDAGSNTLDRTDYTGTHVLAWFPNPAPSTQLSDAVPDCVTHIGSTVVVGDLSGRIWTYRFGKLSQLTLSGAPIMSIGSCQAVGDDLYVTDIFGGKVLRVNPYGRVTTLASGLTNPIGIAVYHNRIYVTNNSLTPSGGQVVRLNMPAWD